MSIGDMIETYAFPLILIVIAAFISHWLIPKITQKWQNHQKVLELKTGIITELIKLLMEILVNGDVLGDIGGRTKISWCLTKS